MTFNLGLAGQLYVIANAALMIGYLALPVLIVPYLSFRTRTKAAWMVFFIGCVGTHAVAVWQAITLVESAHHHGLGGAGWFAATWHVGQAFGTWAAIIYARQDLARADAFLHKIIGREASGGGSAELAG